LHDARANILRYLRQLRALRQQKVLVTEAKHGHLLPAPSLSQRHEHGRAVVQRKGLLLSQE